MPPAPDLASALTAWQAHPLPLLILLAAAGWYVRRWWTARNDVFGWPTRRVVAFAAGLALGAWTVTGWPAVYAPTLMWAWTVQMLILLLVVPVLLMAGQPIALSRTGRRAGPVAGVADSSAVRLASSALVSPLIVPVTCGLLFFARLGDLVAHRNWAATLLGLVLVLLGALVARPLTDVEDRRSSVAVGIGLAVGMLELVLDAVPGIALRLSTHPVADWFVHDRASWAGGWARDQGLAGNVAWSVAELLDLPFLVIVFVRWVHADRREAQDVDALRDADRAAAGLDPAAADPPWWLDDPRFADRRSRRPHRPS